MADITAETPEEKAEKVSSSSSSSDEDDKPKRPRKKAATKRRTYKPVSTDIPSCGIYSTLSTDSGLEQLKFTNLPPGFSLDDEDDEDDDDDISIVRKKRNKPERRKENNNSAADLIFVGDSTPNRVTTPTELRSPSPPPPPSLDLYLGQKRQRTPTKTSKILRNVDAAVLRYKITSSLSTSLNDSISSTPGGSSKVIDIDNYSPNKNRKDMTVKIRTRGGMQKFVMQMNEMFTNVMETLAKIEGVDKSWIKLVKADDDILEFDTPSALKLRISDIVECVIVDPSSVPIESESLDITPSLDDCVQIKIQGQDRTSKMNYSLQKDGRMAEIMSKYSQSCGVPLDKLKFYFDGDVIDPSQTPEDLDMDDENVVDVVISG